MSAGQGCEVWEMVCMHLSPEQCIALKVMKARDPSIANRLINTTLGPGWHHSSAAEEAVKVIISLEVAAREAL